MDKIRIGVIGYGNLGRGVHYALAQHNDMQLVTVFTRRNPSEVVTAFPVNVDKIENIKNYKDKIDVMIMCGGSAIDLPEQVPMAIKYFNTVDSFDTHAKIPEYFQTINQIALQSKRVAAISVGWDPGLFSIARTLFEAVSPNGNTYTFWGKGVSQGHSDAIRKVDGVKNAIQYTVPIEQAIQRVRVGENPILSTKDKHLRECFVVPKAGADLAKIENAIKTMPNYFADYNTVVHFITDDQLQKNHSKMPHGGFVIRTGTSANNNKDMVEFGLKLESNPEFTSKVLVAYARAVQRMNKDGKSGAVTVLDVPIGLLLPKSKEELQKELV